MSTALQTAAEKGPVESAFGTLLAETLLEMDAAELMGSTSEDPVERLSLEAQQAVFNQTGRPLPRIGAHIYRTTAVTPPAQTHPGLDVRY